MHAGFGKLWVGIDLKCSFLPSYIHLFGLKILFQFIAETFFLCEHSDICERLQCLWQEENAKCWVNLALHICVGWLGKCLFCCCCFSRWLLLRGHCVSLVGESETHSRFGQIRAFPVHHHGLPLWHWDDEFQIRWASFFSFVLCLYYVLHVCADFGLCSLLCWRTLHILLEAWLLFQPEALLWLHSIRRRNASRQTCCWARQEI